MDFPGTLTKGHFPWAGDVTGVVTMMAAMANRNRKPKT